MKAQLRKLILASLALLSLNAIAVTHYVDLNSPSPTLPYTDWPTAATNIQDAIDAAVDGDLVLVTNGIYGQGGRVVFGAMTNRVAVTKRITVQSVNGPNVTIIQGRGALGDSAVRCVYLTNGAWLVGFTVTNGATRLVGDQTKEQNGGGVWCESNAGPLSTHAFISNCVIAFSFAGSFGGGGYRGEYRNCIMMTNWARFGGGISGGTLGNCLVVGNVADSFGGGVDNSPTGNANYGNTVVGNSAPGLSGGGLNSVDMRNSIVYFNSGGNYSGGILSYCCTTPKPSPGQAITNSPRFVDPASLNFRLQSDSPCINAGDSSTVWGNADLDGNPRIVGGTVDIGAYEYQSPSSVLSYAWAQQYGFPIDGSVDYADPDGDGMSNYGECRSDTVPTNALSVLRMLSVTNAAIGLKVTWQSVNTRTYYLQRSTNMGEPFSFQTIAANLIGMVGTTNRTDTSATNGGPYFYRVGVQ